MSAGGPEGARAVSLSIGLGEMVYEQEGTAQGFAGVLWSGFSGLGGLDLTNGGLDDAFVVEISEISIPGHIVINVSSSAEARERSSRLLQITEPGRYVLPFDDFIPDPFIGPGADFTNVNAIGLRFQSSPVVDAPGSVTFSGPFRTIPEPASWRLVAFGILLVIAGKRARRSRMID